MDYDYNNYYILYLGEAEVIYNDSQVVVYGVPMATTSFANRAGGSTPAIMIAGIDVYDIGYDYYPYDNYDWYNEWIFHDSDVRYLEDEELENLSAEELSFARNEIYARYGRIFQSKDLSDYFSSMTWYYPIIPADEFTEDRLNSIEKANIEKIKKYEERLIR